MNWEIFVHETIEQVVVGRGYALVGFLEQPLKGFLVGKQVVVGFLDGSWVELFDP